MPLQQVRHVARRPGPADEARQRSREAVHVTSRSGLSHARTITAGRSSGTVPARSPDDTAITSRPFLGCSPRLMAAWMLSDLGMAIQTPVPWVPAPCKTPVIE